MITNVQSGTNVHEIADGIFRINTPLAIPGAGAFNFNQYLIVDDEPVLFHTEPTTVACMHGSAWRGDGAALLRALAVQLAPAA